MRAQIHRDSPRRSLWMEVFGADTIPILEPPQVKDGHKRMLVDLREMSPEVLRKLAVKLAKLRRMPSDRIIEEMKATGSVLLSAEDVSVVEEVGSLFP